jgi:site-specific recombinase XerC
MMRCPERESFLSYLTHERNDSPHTVKAYQRDLDVFQAFCDDYFGGASEWTWQAVDRLTVRSFMGELGRRGMTKRSVSRAVSALRTFYRFLNERCDVAGNPVAAIRLPKTEQRLPAVLDRRQVEEVFLLAERWASENDFAGVRDLTILEFFYSTGMRLSELAGVNLADVDIVSEQVKVRGKGRKERLLPLGSFAVDALRRYLLVREVAGKVGAVSRQCFWRYAVRGCRPAACSMWCANSSTPSVGTPASRCTAYDTALPRICSTPVPTSGRSRNCSDMPRSARHRCILILVWSG